MRKLLFFIAFVIGSTLTSFVAAAQADSTSTIVCYVETVPELITGGGSAGIVAAIKKNLVYPRSALRARVKGRVFVKFTVTAAGLVRDVYVIKGLRPDCNTAAVQAVRKLPRFNPCKQAGKPVACSFTVPITFALGSAGPATRPVVPTAH